MSAVQPEPSYWSWKEFSALDSPPDGFRYELHDGEVVLVPPAKPRHARAQEKLLRLLFDHLRNEGIIRDELPYRPAAEYQFWYADVAFVPHPLWDRVTAQEDWIPYAPALIVEVLSPSNRRSKVERQRDVAFEFGAQQFWIVDALQKMVTVSSHSVDDITYHPGSHIPLDAFAPDARHIAVDDIFA